MSVRRGSRLGGWVVLALAVSQAACIHRTKDRPTLIEGRYIVAIKRSLAGSNESERLLKLKALIDGLVAACGERVRPGLLYPRTLFGFSVETDPAGARCLEKHDESVRLVEPDMVIVAADAQNTGWGLDRVDQPSLPMNGTFNYPASAGANVSLWVLDSGVNHVDDLSNRVTWEQNFVPSKNGTTPPTDCTDEYGHGTHVSGVAAGTKYGVAKKASVRAVKVLDKKGKGNNSWLIGGVEWVATNSDGPTVVNMSLIAKGGTSVLLDDAVRAAIEKGLLIVVAAGNYGRDACNYSPSRVEEALVVGASKADDWIWPDSNQGSCVDVFAPGQHIYSVWGKNSKIHHKSGTSFAAPHVAGAAALYLGENLASRGPQAEKQLLGDATTGVLHGVSASTANVLLCVK